jgi:hypothetical protein
MGPTTMILNNINWHRWKQHTSSWKFFFFLKGTPSLPPTQACHFQFGSVFIIKKTNQTEIFLKNNRTEIGSNRSVSIRFGFLRQNRFKPVLAWFSRFWLGFFGLAQFFSSLALVFFWFFPVWVRFGFFSFFLIKPKPDRTGWFFLKF